MIDPAPDPAPRAEPPPGRSFAARLAARLAVVVLTGVLLIELRVILIPLVLAILFSLFTLPLVRRLMKARFPHAAAVLVVIALGTLPLTGFVLIFVSSVGPLSQALPKYQERLTTQSVAAMDWVLERAGSETLRATIQREVGENLMPELLSQGVTLVQGSLQAATVGLGYFLLALLFSAFILFEGTRLREKFAEAFGADNPLTTGLAGIGRDVRRYVVAKTAVSALTGLCVWGLLALCGVDFAAFWALLAFPLNFIPTVGSIVASIPPILVALIDPSLSPALTVVVFVGLLAINGFIGSVLDPRIVGQAVKLSPLVVLLSMVTWGLLWGPVGGILAVPIMVSFKVIFARFPALAPIAILMKG